jgi:hypothetical protein
VASVDTLAPGTASAPLLLQADTASNPVMERANVIFVNNVVIFLNFYFDDFEMICVSN